jgi:putative ABC transport system permease protein
MPGPGEAYLSIGAAEALGIRIGETVTVRDIDMQTLSLRVTGIYENHVNNYIVVTPETIQQQWGEGYDPQVAYVSAAKGKDVHSLGATISAMDGVMNVMVTQDQANMVSSMMDALVMVVITVLVCAGLLAVTVLYNLTNININERLREIATIKVLGFNAKETAAYVFKENVCLTVMGTFLGLFAGKWLLEFVMSQVKIDMVWFTARLIPQSYVLSIVLTLLSAVFVNFIFRRKLDKINMAEALKSVE